MYSFSFWVHLMFLLNIKFSKSVIKRSLDGRILHGENASISDHAHAVLIQVIKSDRSSHTCGSSILNQKFLLTAAHCVKIKGEIKVIAFAGHENVRKSPVSRMAINTITHKKFEVSGTVKNDIALVVLNENLPLGANIKRIILKKTFPVGVTGTLAGWGMINEVTLEGTDILKHLTQKVRGKKCGVIHPEPGMFCAGSMKPSNPTPSLGDSGSGLISKKFQIMGILSYKISKHPALPVYTNVSYFYQWIKESILTICEKR